MPLSMSAEGVAADLRTYGEFDVAEWVLSCSQEELLRICDVADWLLCNGPSKASGSSMYISTAAAWAAVYVREGAPRDMARKRRVPKDAGPAPGPDQERRPDMMTLVTYPRHSSVGDDVKRYWQEKQSSGLAP